MNGERSMLWSPDESTLFFDGLVKHGRIWSLVSQNVRTRSVTEVQMYYNNLLQQINDALDLSACDLNLHDVVDQMITVLSFWTLTCERRDNLDSPEFQGELRDVVTFQKNRITNLKRIIVRLVPRSNELANSLLHLGVHAPCLQLTVSPNRSIPQIIHFINAKWGNLPGVSGVLKLFPPLGMGPMHKGWSEFDDHVTVDSIFRQLHFPDPFSLEYDFVRAENVATPRYVFSSLASSSPMAPDVKIYNQPTNLPSATNEHNAPQIAQILTSLDGVPGPTIASQEAHIARDPERLPESRTTEVVTPGIVNFLPSFNNVQNTSESDMEQENKLSEEPSTKKRKRSHDNETQLSNQVPQSSSSQDDSLEEVLALATGAREAKIRQIPQEDSNSQHTTETFFDSIFKVEFNRRFTGDDIRKPSEASLDNTEAQKLYMFDDDSRNPTYSGKAEASTKERAGAQFYEDSLGFSNQTNQTKSKEAQLFTTSSLAVTNGGIPTFDHDNEDIKGFTEKTGFIPFRSLK
eukprot:TRINITY_DN3297_c0_g1_i1.p1 TRINITY_DN3297_c0_g1~~TRINITY_DN3297_c0_g1_i1.p1  ORF type:complete len:533 (+),score=75.38 TRINITY_DN3297_c0_g1_i1:46-1599(+)